MLRCPGQADSFGAILNKVQTIDDVTLRCCAPFKHCCKLLGIADVSEVSSGLMDINYLGC